MTVLECHSYRSFLKGTLAEREKGNPRYSLRALARRLGIAPSYLSAVLAGKKNLSGERALELADRLGMNPAEREYFFLLVQMEGTADPRLKEAFLERARAVNPATQVSDLSLEHFRIISNWYHFAILAATELPGQETTPAALARSLGISKPEAELALERLEKLEMIERDRRGRIRKTNANPRAASHAPNQALRSFHRQTLQKAIESLETQSPRQKVVGSETVAIDAGQLEEFRALADRFFDEAVLLARKAKRKNRVYHLGVQFFDLTSALSQGEKP